MADNDSGKGCLIIIVFISAILAILIATGWITKEIGQAIKENPGLVFVVLIVIVVVGWAIIRD